MTAGVRLTRSVPRIPLTVIGGFLGAGKTTLLNRMLAETHGVRLAVVVNDFGAVNIDAALVRSRSADTISLTNGCVCCQIGDALGDALARLIESERPPEWIVIEASGVSDPWRIAQVGLADPALSLDGVVVMADAQAIRAHAADVRIGDVIRNQLRAADVVVLNKMDGRGPDRELDAWVSGHAGGAPLFHATDAIVPMTVLTGLALSRPALLAGGGAMRACSCAADCGCAVPETSHGAIFDSMAIGVRDTVFRVDALRALLRDMPGGVLRMKGVIRTERHGLAELQFAGKHGSLRKLAAGLPGESSDAPDSDADCALVAIGMRGALPRGVLTARLHACIDATAISRLRDAGTTDRSALALPAQAAHA